MTAAPPPTVRGRGLDLSRRGVLAAGLVLPLAGCTGPSPGPSPTGAPSPRDTDAALRSAAVQRERALLAAYDEHLADAPSPGLRAVRDEHAEHLAALDPAAVVPPAPAPPRGVTGRARTTARLRAAEREAAAAHAADALPASRALAALLASLAAAEAAHGVALA